MQGESQQMVGDAVHVTELAGETAHGLIRVAAYEADDVGAAVAAPVQHAPELTGYRRIAASPTLIIPVSYLCHTNKRTSLTDLRCCTLRALCTQSAAGGRRYAAVTRQCAQPRRASAMW